MLVAGCTGIKIEPEKKGEKISDRDERMMPCDRDLERFNVSFPE